MSFNLTQAVGLNPDGSFAANLALDQQQVAELLMQVPLPSGGLMTSTGPAVDLPAPFVDGAISGELLGAIQTFQTVQSAGLNVDLRVDPGGGTLALLVQLATGPAIPTFPLATVVLDASAQVVEEAPPAPVSGLPSLAYRPADVEQLVFDNGAVRITMSFSGLLGASWGPSFGLACLSSPSFLALDQAVKSGDVRRIGATALDQSCSELRAQTRFAANGLFSAVTMGVDTQGTFSVSGSLGDRWRQLSVGFVFPNTIVATGSLTISTDVPVPTLGGTVAFNGTMACSIRVMLRDQAPPDQASALANLAVLLIAGRVVLVPAAAWIAEATSIGAARDLVRRAAAGLLRERVMLGPSPGLP
jgi:hypothetical protein